MKIHRAHLENIDPVTKTMKLMHNFPAIADSKIEASHNDIAFAGLIFVSRKTEDGTEEYLTAYSPFVQSEWYSSICSSARALFNNFDEDGKGGSREVSFVELPLSELDNDARNAYLQKGFEFIEDAGVHFLCRMWRKEGENLIPLDFNLPKIEV